MRALLLVAGLAAALLAQDAGRPRHNNSYVPADDQTTLGLVEEARAAAAAGNAERAADRLQALLLGTGRGLVPVRGREIFVAPRRWAQIQLLSEQPPFGPDVLAAWREDHDAKANSAIGGAIVSGDENELLDLLDRHPAATAAPVALLALADRALQRGDPDASLGYLLRLPEHVARSEEEGWLGTAAYRERLAHVRALPARRPAGWPTIGGDATRSRNGDALAEPNDLVLRWRTPILERNPFLIEDPDREHSVVLPFYPVCDATRVYVHAGTAVAVLDRGGGKLLHWLPKGAEGPNPEAADDLTLKSPGVRSVTIHDGTVYFARILFRARQWPYRNTLYAVDADTQRTIWLQRGESLLAKPVFFRGAPAIHGERLYVYGAVREVAEDEATRKEEAYLFCLDRRTGAHLWHRFLGYGETDAAPSMPPQSGLAPAVASGVVVAATGLGVTAALDARTGEILWVLRYSRLEGRERQRLLDDYELQEKVHLPSAWMREPPRIVGDTVYFAAFDGKSLHSCWLRGQRNRLVGYSIVKDETDREEGHRNSLFEYIAGIRGSRVYLLGRMDERNRLSYTPLYSHDYAQEQNVWAYGLLPFANRSDVDAVSLPPELYGRPVIAGSVLLVPTREMLYRYGVEPRDGRNGNEESIRELPPLARFAPPGPGAPAGDEPPALFGNLVAVDGFLYAATGDHVICYGPR